MKILPTLASAATLELALHLVPAGRRLDFPTPLGLFAYVYRRGRNQTWQCVARNACSPYFDWAASQAGTMHDYLVQYRNGQGTVVHKTSVVRAAPASLPASPSWVALR